MRNNILPEDVAPVIELLQQCDPRLTAGPSVLEFEKSWSNWLGVPYSVFVNSGSSANLACLAWLKNKFPDGGKVIVPPLTWSSDISSVYWMGFEPLFVDITLTTLACNENLIQDSLQLHSDIRAVFLTHAQGLNGLTKKISDLCDEHGIYLIEDVCESHGVRTHTGDKAGTHGALSCFSFYYAHHMSTIEGGMICTHDEDTYQFLRMIRSHGMLREVTDNNLRNDYIQKYPDLNPQFIFTYPGFNIRSNEISALIGLSQLRRLDDMIAKRVDNFSYFLDNLPTWAFSDFNLEGQSNYAFNLILKEPDPDLMRRIESIFFHETIEYRRGSAGGGNQLRQPYLQDYVTANSILPNVLAPVTDHIHFYGMYLGNYPELPRDELDYLLSVINRI